MDPARTDAAFSAGETSLTGILAAALERHRAGALDEAEALFVRALEIMPDHARALHHLGVIAHQKGEHERAIELIGRALELNPDDAGAHCNLGAAWMALDRALEAEAAFRRAAALSPELAEAHSNLAAVLGDLGRWEEAAAAYRAAHRAAPGVPRFVKRLADLYLEHGQFEEAIEWFHRFLALAEDNGEVSNNMGYAYERLGRMEESERWYRRAVELCPDSPEIVHNMGKALKRLGRHEEAEAFFARALTFAPDRWNDLASLAGSYVNRGQVDRAIPIYRRLLEDDPDNPKLCNDYAIALMAKGRFSEAEAYYERAIAADPDFAEAYNNLGGCRTLQGKRAEALEDYRRAITHAPRYLDAHINLCLALAFQDRLDEAYVFARATTQLEDYRPRHFSNVNKVFRAVCDFDGIDGLGDPWANIDALGHADISTNFLEMLVLADSEETIARLAELHRRWYRDFVRPNMGEPLPPLDLAGRSGPLRVGIISSDLRSHSVAKFVRPVIEHHDRTQMEIHCYSPMESPGDPMQEWIRSQVAAFTVVRDRNDREFAELIRDDRIDILFELNGFTRDSRLKVLAYRPAPVQIYWLGYPFTTGIAEIDYILLDPFVKPVNESWFVEKPLLMPECWVSFGSFAPEPISDALPVERNGGVVTFGSLNNPYKVTREVVARWARVMHAVPNSRFLYVRPECGSFVLCANLTREFVRNGIGAERLFFVNNRTSGLSHLSFYDEIDITLDTFPLTGGTTTCDTLWMGTPVVTRYGPSMHQRLSYSHLNNVGLAELCVETDDDYVRTAAALANDREALRLLRRELRGVVQNSALGRGADFARHFCALMTELACRHGLR